MIFDKEEHKEIVIQLIDTSIYTGNLQKIGELYRAIGELRQVVIKAKIKRKNWFSLKRKKKE